MSTCEVCYIVFYGLCTAGRLLADENRWEPHILKFEAEDRAAPPPKEAVLFLGSSTIAGWDVKNYFPEVETINRGFGGSQISDCTFFADRIVIPYQPRLIVFYAGDNDLAAGRTPEQVAGDYEAFVAKVRTVLPNVWIAFLAIKPSLARWKLVEQIRTAIALIRQQIATDPQALFIDIGPPMLGERGIPRPELFKEDGLHLNEAGYALWSEILRPYLWAGKWVTTESGLRYMDVKVGDGPHPRAGQTVTVHFVGTFEDGTPFDPPLEPWRGGLQFSPWAYPNHQRLEGGHSRYESRRCAEAAASRGLSLRGKELPPTLSPNATLLFTIELLEAR